MPYLRLFLKSTLFLLFFCLNTKSFAQSNFYKFTVGLGYGATLSYPDAETRISKALYADMYFNLTPFSNFGAEYQRGGLIGGENKSENSKSWFTNNYNLLNLNGRLHFGEFLSRRALKKPIFDLLKGVYVGAGVGLMKNIGINYFEKENPSEEDKKGRPFDNKEIVFPLNIGYSYDLIDKWGHSKYVLNFNIQSSVALDDGIDGNVNPYSSFTDLYNYISIGVKYNFGTLGLYQKR